MGPTPLNLGVLIISILMISIACAVVSMLDPDLARMRAQDDERKE